jgi:hypothetical protein
MPDIIQQIAVSNPALALLAYSILVNLWLVTKFLKHTESTGNQHDAERRRRDDVLIKQFQDERSHLLSVIENNTHMLALINAKLRTESPSILPYTKPVRRFH